MDNPNQESNVGTQDMTTDEMISQALERYSLTDAAIASLSEACLIMVVDGEDDKAGHDIVRAARLSVKAQRVLVEKTRKDLKADALAYGKAVDGEAKRIRLLLEPIEAHLQEQEDIVAGAAARREEVEKAAKLALLRERMAALEEAESGLLSEDVRTMSAEDFGAALTHANGKFDERRAEAERIEAADAKLRADQAEAAAEVQKANDELAANMEAAQAKLDEERAVLDRERQAIEDGKREVQRVKDEQAAEEQAARDAEAQAEQDAKDAEAREALKPFNDKLRELAVTVEGAAVELIAEHDLDGSLEVGITAVLHRAANELRSIADR